MLDATGRLYSRPASYSTDLSPLQWDAGEPWRFTLEVRQDDRDQWNITGTLRRGEERMDLNEPALLLADGFLVANENDRALRRGRRLRLAGPIAPRQAHSVSRPRARQGRWPAC